VQASASACSQCRLIVSRLDAYRSFDCLKVDWKEVDQGKIRAGIQEGEDTGRPDTALLEQARHEQRTLVHIPLVDDEGNGQDNENFLERRRDGFTCLGRLKEEDEDGGGDSPEGQVDPEAPSLGCGLCQNTAKERTDESRNSVGATHGAHIDWLMLGRCGESNHDERPRGHTGSASALKSTAKDQRSAIP
jgi:hypothetical protein